MQLQFSPILWVHAVTVILLYSISVYCWGLRPARGATLWSLVAGAALFWTIGDALELLSTDLVFKMAAIRFSYIGLTTTIYFFSLFTIAYSTFDHWLTTRSRILLGIIPGLTLLLVFTTPLHTLFYQDVMLVSRWGLVIADKVYGPMFWVFVAYSYVVIAGGASILILSVLRYPHVYRGQAMTVVLAALMPFGGNLAYLGLLRDISPVDLSPLAFMVSGIFVAYSIRRYRFLDIVPVAHDLVFKHVNTAVVIIDESGRIIELNASSEKILGKSRREVIGLTLFEALPSQSAFMEGFRSVRETRDEITIVIDERTYELHIAPLNDRTGRPAGRIIMLYDITTQKQAVDERDRLISDLDAYARTVAHDLKVPVAAMIGLASMLKDRKGIPPSEQTDLVDRIMAHGLSMSEIIQSLLMLARIRTEQDMPTAPFEMAPVLEMLQFRLDTLIRQGEATLILPESWPTAIGHPQWIEEVWANLISNAVKYGGKPPKIELSATHIDGNMLRFSVKDNGKGLTPEEQKQIFTEFVRVENQPSHTGHGLGLAIVQRIVTRLGGEVSVESEVGKGSTFSFTLPAASADSKKAPIEPTAG